MVLELCSPGRLSGTRSRVGVPPSVMDWQKTLRMLPQFPEQLAGTGPRSLADSAIPSGLPCTRLRGPFESRATTTRAPVSRL